MRQPKTETATEATPTPVEAGPDSLTVTPTSPLEPSVALDEFLAGRDPMDRAVLNGYFRRERTKDSPTDARPPRVWAELLQTERTRKTR